MNRRRMLALLGLTGLGIAAYRLWPDQGWWNPCPRGPLPDALLRHESVLAAWQGIEPSRVWDCHVHLAGVGDGDSGIHLHPDPRSLRHPVAYTRYRFYANAACVDAATEVDRAYVQRLHELQQGFHSSSRLMLLAFDYRHDANGRAQPGESPIHVPNRYAAALHRLYPDRFEWIASIHPYREDAVEALEQAVAQGARAVKWLPSVMGIDPASRRCDAFYAALQRHGLPLLSHAGAEYALELFGADHLNHPLRLRRPLDLGVKVIVAHCATLGSAPDLDRGLRAGNRPNLEYFARLMNDRHYERLLYGDLSAITQVNRGLAAIHTIFRHSEWHDRLLNGSDYPLPGVMPLYPLERFRSAGALDENTTRVLTELRPHHPLLFDFVLKRSLSFGGAKLDRQVFETAGFFRDGG